MGRIHQLKARAAGRRPRTQTYVLRLFTTGSTPRSTRALRNLREICDSGIKGEYRLEVVDICQEPGRASEANIIAAPTLVKYQPPPTCRVIGDLSDRDKVMTTLNLAVVLK
ncbi:MAG TPA: circadian clock KaiB family protein [Candidatus Binataceae bacterium]|nr:circadian clock KaiB family protein [Candidatus Binataceae bacterium]